MSVKKQFTRFLAEVLLWRTAAVVVLTSSLWLTIWFYDWSYNNVGPGYAIAFGWISGLSGLGVVIACIVKAASYVD